MTVMYINKQGSLLKYSNKNLIVEYQGQKLEKIPLMYINKVLVFGNIQVTSQTLSMLLENGIDLSFFSYKGKLRGGLSSLKSKNIYLRLAHFERFNDKKFRINLIKQVVRAKLSNQLAIIKKYQSNYPLIDLDVKSQINTLEKVIEEIYNRFEVDELMGLEGAGSAAYFKFFSKVVKGDFIFDGRKYYPSPDPVNAMLSLGYVMITNEIASLLEASSFDPFLGFFHGIRYGRQSLPLDLVEEFRQPIIDLFTLKLINKKVFSKDDFEYHNDGSCYFLEDSLKKYFSKYEDLMCESVKDINQEEKTWRDFFKRQVERFSDSLINDAIYQPFLI